MKLHELAPKIEKPARRRRGQGNATGHGTFSGRGCKGQKARTGKGVRHGFEGGQTPLIQRMPKRRGFKNPNRIETQVVDIADLDVVFEDGAKVDLMALLMNGLLSRPDKKVKILASGEISKKIEVSGIPMSKTAKAAIEKAGGSVTE